MKRLLFTLFCFAGLTVLAQNNDKQAISNLKARNAPEWLTKGIMYQIQPRAFTPEGTLTAATARLSGVAGIGVDIIYLCPVFVADDDMDQASWSKRQKASGMNNPRNPYRMKDYYHVDPEYGTDDDLRALVAEAHRLGMKVMLDMVYLHCGPKAVFLEKHPDFIKYGEDGKAVNAAWSFPGLNFGNPALREYLWKNMEYWVTDFGVDGFRCDVADGVPLDFWETARERLEKIRPDIVLLAEGTRPQNLLKAFDINYGFTLFGAFRSVYRDKKPASLIRETWEKIAATNPEGARFIRYIDNHDISNDDWHNRIEKAWGYKGVNAALALVYTLDGVPFLYNGQEVADTARHSIFGRLAINWENGKTPEGRERTAYCRRLAALRHHEQALTGGTLQWLDNDQPESVLSFLRILPDEQILTVVNLSGEPRWVHVSGIKDAKKYRPLLTDGVMGKLKKGILMQEHGYWIGKIKTLKNK